MTMPLLDEQYLVESLTYLLSTTSESNKLGLFCNLYRNQIRSQLREIPMYSGYSRYYMSSDVVTDVCFLNKNYRETCLENAWNINHTTEALVLLSGLDDVSKLFRNTYFTRMFSTMLKDKNAKYEDFEIVLNKDGSNRFIDKVVRDFLWYVTPKTIGTSAVEIISKLIDGGHLTHDLYIDTIPLTEKSAKALLKKKSKELSGTKLVSIAEVHPTVSKSYVVANVDKLAKTTWARAIKLYPELKEHPEYFMYTLAQGKGRRKKANDSV